LKAWERALGIFGRAWKALIGRENREGLLWAKVPIPNSQTGSGVNQAPFPWGQPKFFSHIFIISLKFFLPFGKVPFLKLLT